MAVHENNKKLTYQNIRTPHLRGIGWVLGKGKQDKKLMINVDNAK